MSALPGKVNAMPELEGARSSKSGSSPNWTPSSTMTSVVLASRGMACPGRAGVGVEATDVVTLPAGGESKSSSASQISSAMAHPIGGVLKVPIGVTTDMPPLTLGNCMPVRVALPVTVTRTA